MPSPLRSISKRLGDVGTSFKEKAQSSFRRGRAAVERSKDSFRRGGKKKAKDSSPPKSVLASLDLGESSTNLFAQNAAIQQLLDAYKTPKQEKTKSVGFERRGLEAERKGEKKKKGESETDLTLVSAEALFNATEQRLASVQEAVEALERLRANAEGAAAESGSEAAAAISEVEELTQLVGMALVAKKLSATDCLREWDVNRDGKLQLIEVRRAVRNHLGLKAMNTAIDALFQTFDKDRSGYLDLKEMELAIGDFRDAAERAKLEEQHAENELAELRVRMNATLATAHATKAAEEAREVLLAVRDSLKQTVDVRIATMLHQANAKDQRLLAHWRAKSDGGESETISKNDFRLKAVSCEGASAKWLSITATKAELEAFYDRLCEQTKSSPLDVRQGVRLVMEQAATVGENADKLAKDAEDKLKVARQLQRELAQADAAAVERAEQDNKAMAEAEVAKADAARRAQEAREVKKMAEAAKKAEARKQFEAKVAAKRGFDKPVVV